MAFDANIHQIKMIVIKCGEHLFPEEKNVTTLYHKTSALLGIDKIETNSLMADKIPNVIESMKAQGKLFPCPKCGEQLDIFSLCRSCKEAEDGKYHTKFSCGSCGYFEKSEKFVIDYLNELGIEYKSISKKDLGILTITDKGLQ
jgi:predicted RNA-binding Zn-ribbon protein involved in translation (DUF1610 family)